MASPRSEPAAAGSLTHSEIRSIIIGVIVAMFLAALDQTIVATAMPTMGRDLGDFEHLPWVVTAYLLAATAVTPLYGKVSDIVGRRMTMLVAIGVFIVGSAICALAPNMLALILARALQGLGGGGLISLAQTVIADIVSPKERARYQVYIAGVFMTSSVAGPALGGFFAEHLHWSLIFWINLPLGLLAFWMTNALLKKIPRHERPHRLDVLGAVLMTAATVSLMLALDFGGIRYPWTSIPIIGLFVVSLAFWLLFALRLKLAPEPLIPTDVLRNPVVKFGTLAAFCGMGVFIGLSIYLPIYLEAVYRLTSSQSGLALTPYMVGTVVGATISGRVMTKVKHYKRIPLIGLVAAVVALILLAVRAEDLTLTSFEILLTIASIGLGALLPVTTVAVQNAVFPHQMGTATGAMNFFRSLGGALIVAGFGAILLGSLPQFALVNASPGSLAPVLAENGADIARIFHWVYAAAAFGLILALISLLAMEERPLRSQIHGEEAPPAA